MAWKAFLETVQDPTAPSDSVNVNVRFTDAATGRTLTKGFSLQAVNFKQVQSFKDLMAQEIQTLTDFDGAATGIRAFIGKEIK